MTHLQDRKIPSLLSLVLIFAGIAGLALGLFQSAMANGPEPTTTPRPDSLASANTTSIIYLPLVIRSLASVDTPPSDNPHSAITIYEDPQTCITCHATEANHALNSEHVQWNGKWKHVNTYCTAPEPADYSCRSCHATTGKVTNLTVNDVDCLICHQDIYQRALGPLTVPVAITDWQGNTMTYNTPQKNVQGEYQMQPRFDLMPPGTTMTQLARTVYLPTRATCLRCHAKAGGGDGVKRGDMSTASINPSYLSDVHLSPDGANLLCQDCHSVTNHQIPGRGIDLRIAEGGSVKACLDCHTSSPHYTLARALGTIQDSKLYPIKVHTAYQPRHNASGRMVQYDVLWNFMTGFFEQAAARGVAFMGLTGSYTWVQTRAEQLITHGVAPQESALQCEACHNNGSQMDLANLGYTLKGSAGQTCTQCHRQEDDDLNWQSVHSIHVDEERRDCSWCHTFSRPERGLRLP